MEEILASIRRIIEDNEAGRKDEPESKSEAYVAAPREVEDFRAELKPLSPPRQREQERSAFLPQQRLERPFDRLPKNEPLPAEPAFSRLADEEDEDERPMPIAANTPSAPPAPARAEPKWQPPQPDRVEAPEPARHGLISETSGRKVAAAFEELNEALLANRRKTLDQLAEEMLRPMLQDWLDNNLPRLVERLVREEIERIARGG